MDLTLSQNKKINRKRVPEYKTDDLETSYVAPRNNLESIIVKAWEKILNKKQISVTDNFFELGADSIRAIQICSELSENGEIGLKIKDFFDYQTVASLAYYVQTQLKHKHL